jgi:hypothetical protein
MKTVRFSFLAPLVLGMAVLFSGCGPKAPDRSLILWEQPSPQIAAHAHARDGAGVLAAFHVLPTGSMEPFLTGGDWIVVDFGADYAGLKAADLVLYQARWLPPGSTLVVHMAAAKSGDEWIMDGIANKVYERGESMRMGRAEYRGKVIQVYTKRKKA